MKLITNIQAPFLSDIIFEKSKNFETIKAAVAYCKNYELFEYCKQHGIKVDYYARLDDSINLDLEKLKSFLTDNISISIIGGSKFHPKVIWCYDYGAYIGSANLTKSAWETNIECGLWLTQKELEDNHLIDPLDDFFKFIQKEAKLLKNVSSQDISKLNEQKQLKEQTQNSLSDSETFRIIKRNFGIFGGCSKEDNLDAKSQSKKKRQTQKLNKKFYTKKAEESFYFFEELRKEIEKRKEMTGLKTSKPLRKDYNCIEINLKSIGYKNHIRAFRTGKSPPHYIGVYYGFKGEDKEYYNRLKKEKMSYFIKQEYFGTGPIESWPMTFNFTKFGGTEEEDKQWIIGKVIEFLRVLRDSEKNFYSNQKNGTYEKGSDWNDLNEMRCLLIFKKLEKERFPRRRQAELCREMENIPNIGLTESSINAKVGNYKSVAGINNSSHYSKNTKRIYEQYKNTPIKKLKRIIDQKALENSE